MTLRRPAAGHPSAADRYDPTGRPRSGRSTTAARADALGHLSDLRRELQRLLLGSNEEERGPEAHRHRERLPPLRHRRRWLGLLPKEIVGTRGFDTPVKCPPTNPPTRAGLHLLKSDPADRTSPDPWSSTPRSAASTARECRRGTRRGRPRGWSGHGRRRGGASSCIAGSAAMSMCRARTPRRCSPKGSCPSRCFRG